MARAPWRPANELEARLCAAVDHGDLESYLAILRTEPVVVPVTGLPDEPGWLVTTVDGLRHVAVFTSHEAMQTYPDARELPKVELTLAEVSKRWPGPRWRLAVNPGLDIAVYLPGSYALSTGSRPGAADPVTVLELPDLRLDGYQEIRTGTFATENRAEHDLLQALVAADPDQALRAVLDSTLFLVSTEKDGYTAPGQPGFRWLTVGTKGGDAVPVFTSRDRADRGLRNPTYTKLPVRLLDLSEAWPDHQLALVVNPGAPLTMRLPGAGVLGLTELAEKLGIRREAERVGEHHSGFRPGAEPDPAGFDVAVQALRLYYQPGGSVESREPAELALLEAAAAGDRAAFLRILLGTSLRLPVARGDDPGVRYGGQPFPWQTSVIGDRTVLQVFTSSRRQREVSGDAGRSGAEAANLLRYWPDPGWDLAVNPGTPIGAVLPGDQVAALSAWYDKLVAHELAGSFPVTERVDLQLLDAARRGDRAGFLELLRPVKVVVTASEPGLPWDVSPTDPRFPWEPVPVWGRASLLVYSSLDWQRRAAGSGTIVRPELGELAAAWPAGGPDLVLNPASPISVTMTAEEVQAFARG